MAAVFANRSDRLLTQLGFNAVSVLARLLAGVVLFVFMARQMGPSSFGQFMYAMSLAALLAFPASLGFGQQGLREVAVHPMRAESIVTAIFSALALMVAPLWTGCFEFGLKGAVGASLLVFVVGYSAYARRLRKLR